MKSFNTPFKVCAQNLRKLLGDYRVLVALSIIFVVNNFNANPFIKFKDVYLPESGIAPWIFVFIFTGYSFIQILIYGPLLLLFCDAPFIDPNQPYVVSRCSRKAWSLGQVFYIIAVSAIYVLVSVLMSMLMLVGNMELTGGWGDVINSAGKNNNLEYARATGVVDEIIVNFSPLTAMLYTMFLMWLACIFVGLLIYVINAVTQKNGLGIFVSGLFVLINCAFDTLGSMDTKFQWLFHFSPVSWCSIKHIHTVANDGYPTITFVLLGYAVLIIGLAAAAVLISKKQEIKVIQAV